MPSRIKCESCGFEFPSRNISVDDRQSFETTSVPNSVIEEICPQCMLVGPPACAKSLFMLQIEKGMQHEVYYTEGAATTKAGLQKFISENPHKEIIIIDEIDKMPIQHQEGLLTMMERGEFTTTKVRNTQTVKANMVIFATSNSTERLSKPLLSRFAIFEL
jgi:Holliday junction resolvasome RuvABC ATP-dependent DNA helicase subunit